MNPNLEYKTRNAQKILDFLSTGHKSPDDYIGSDMPFFMKNENTEFKIGHHVIPELPDGLNHNIKMMYKIIGNPQTEEYVNDWTFISLNQTLQVYNDRCNNGQKLVFDIGYMYIGMGHIKVLSCDLNTGELFYRIDGGGDDYVREYHKSLIMNYDKKEYTFMDFDVFLEETKQKIY